MKLFSFNQPRALIRYWLSTLPQKGRGKITDIGAALNVSPNQVSQMLSGHRKMTLEHAVELADFMKLTPTESDFFIALVEFENAGTNKLKNYWKAKADSIRKTGLSVQMNIKPEKELDELAKAQFYSSHLFSLVRLYCSVGKGKTVEEICEAFNLERSATSEILNFLIAEGLVVYKNGIHKMGLQSTHVPQGSPYLYRHHTNWRIESLKHLDKVRDEELVFTCPCSLDEKTFVKLKEKFLQLISEAGDLVRASDSDEVACINIDLFWLTK